MSWGARLLPRAFIEELELGIAAAAAGLFGLLFGLTALCALLSRAVGLPLAAASFAGVLLLIALVLVLFLRTRSSTRAHPEGPLRPLDAAAAEPAVFATFLIGFLLARRFSGPR